MLFASETETQKENKKLSLDEANNRTARQETYNTPPAFIHV